MTRSGSWSQSMSARAPYGIYGGFCVRARVRVVFWVGASILNA